jgi:hypothetical protein
MNSTATLDTVIVDISRNEICMISDSEPPKYVSWDNTTTFMYMWDLLQDIKSTVDISYVWTVNNKQYD